MLRPDYISRTDAMDRPKLETPRYLDLKPEEVPRETKPGDVVTLYFYGQIMTLYHTGAAEINVLKVTEDKPMAYVKKAPSGPVSPVP